MKEIKTEKAPGAIGPYVQGYISGDHVFTSGQIGIDPENGKAKNTIEEQTEQVCLNIQAILEEGGSDLEHVVKTTCFLADMNDFASFNEVYARYFVNKPARSCVAVKTLPKGMLCEIEAIAELK